MRVMTLIVAGVLFLSGCATAIPLTYEEQCSLREMKLAGVNSGSAQYGLDTIKSESVSCRIPADQTEEVEVSRRKSITTPKAEYNNTVQSKRLFGAIGYVLYIVPGIVIKIVADNQRQTAIEKSQQIENENKVALP